MSKIQHIVFKVNNPKIISYLFWISFLLVIVFVTSEEFADPLLTPKWIALYLLVILSSFSYSLQMLFFYRNKSRIFSDIHVVSISIAITLLILSLHGICQSCGILDSEGLFKVVGTYDNPAGFAITLCSGMPFILYGIYKQVGVLKYMHIATLILTLIAIVLSQSRAGICCAIIVLITSRQIWSNGFILYRRFIFILLCIIFIVIMCIKTDSSYGRILIWKTTCQMIFEKPLFGYGPNGFDANYMDYQAAFFQNKPDSMYAVFADDIQYPFNEYLHILVNYGITGLFLLICGIGYLCRSYLNKRTIEKFISLLSIITIIVFALFSYPLLYPFTSFMLIYSSMVCLSDNVDLSILDRKWQCLIGTTLLLFSLGAGYCLTNYIQKEREWYSIACNESSQIEEYEKIYHRLKDNKYFLYNYAYVLYERNNWNESRRVAEECRKIWADYDLELLQGLIEMKDKNYTKADIHFEHANHMCPNRFRPLYLRLKNAEASGNSEVAKFCAQTIIGKKVKVPSNEITRIKWYAKKYIESLI